MMKFIFITICLFFNTFSYADNGTFIIGFETAAAYGGEKLTNHESISGQDIYLSDNFLIGPTIEKIFHPKFSIRATAQIGFNSYVVHEEDDTYSSFSTFSIPMDVQGIYWINRDFQIGAGINLIMANSLEESFISNAPSSQRETIRYNFKNSIAPIVSIKLHNNHYNPFYYFGFSYVNHTLSIDNYESNMNLKSEGIKGNKFIFTYGMSWKVKNK